MNRGHRPENGGRRSLDGSPGIYCEREELAACSRPHGAASARVLPRLFEVSLPLVVPPFKDIGTGDCLRVCGSGEAKRRVLPMEADDGSPKRVCLLGTGRCPAEKKKAWGRFWSRPIFFFSAANVARPLKMQPCLFALKL